jgi:HAD superfamily phosphatase (TIGR01668 family)
MITVQKHSLWLPNYIVANILAIDGKLLRVARVTTIVFDLDNTLVARRTNIISAQYVRSISALKKMGFTVLIGSNTRRDITKLAALLDVATVVPEGLSYKPRASFYARVAAAANTQPEHIAMVGDHILYDIFGANRAGYTSILVQALHGKPSPLLRLYTRYALAANRA